MKRIGTPLQPYSEEREKELAQIRLKAMRKIFGNPNMSLQEMKEILRTKEDRGTEVTFLKRPKK